MKYSTYFSEFFRLYRSSYASHEILVNQRSIMADFSLSFGLDKTFIGHFDGLVHISLFLG